jgi:hypothetical protein
VTDAARPIPTSVEGAPPLDSAPPLAVVAGSIPASTVEPLHVMRKLTGRGDVLDGTRVVADVDYALRDIEERGAIHAPPTVDVTGSPAYRRNVYGLMTCPDPGALAGYLGAPLVLHLEDGARLHITIAKVLGPFRYLVQALDAVDEEVR